MKKALTLTMFTLLSVMVLAGHVEKIYTFNTLNIAQNGRYQVITLNNTMPAGLFGEPMLPYRSISLMLPPGEKAVSMEVKGEGLVNVPGSFELLPQQNIMPLSDVYPVNFIKKEAAYQSRSNYPANPAGTLLNGYLNGYSFAMTTFTPVIYNPAGKNLSYYTKVTVRINTIADPQAAAALRNLTSSAEAQKRVRIFSQNPEMMHQYPPAGNLKTGYKVLIITPSQFQAGFQELVDYYNNGGKPAVVATTESIQATAGQDLPEKIRNYIISEYQNNGIEHVILGGDVEFIPYRGFYCYVISGSGYEDYNIPADIYYSSLDGNWNTNNDGKWGEPAEDDLLPEISVGRMSFSNATELAHMVHKSVSYQGNPVQEEMKKPYLVSEFLYDPPLTYGSDYLELLVDDHSDNGYFTHGIPSASNNVTRLYDASGYNWSVGQLLSGINSGKGFIHHCGHANSNYMMRLYNWDINDQNFAQVDGISHNYQLMYSHGCICGAFDDNDCIAEVCTSISNFLVGGVFNSRYGWFDQGTTEGPSAHLHREFISALYHPDPDSACAELGSAHTMSKIMSAPWVGLPGEFEPGAQRWCHYDCNVLGDPALAIWTDNPTVGMSEMVAASGFTINPNPAREKVTLTVSLNKPASLMITLFNSVGNRSTAWSFPSQQPGWHSYALGLPSVPAGVYFLQLQNGDTAEVRKLIIAD